MSVFFHLPGGFSINPRNELLSCDPGVSITPGRFGKNEDRESFIFLAKRLYDFHRILIIFFTKT